MRNKRGPKTESCGTLAMIKSVHLKQLFVAALLSKFLTISKDSPLFYKTVV